MKSIVRCTTERNNHPFAYRYGWLLIENNGKMRFGLFKREAHFNGLPRLGLVNDRKLGFLGAK